MQGDAEILNLLNEQLTSELTAINQYFLHSKMQDNWGFTELAAHTRAESFDEMKHAEALTDRILLLDGLPNYQRLFSVRIGQTIREQFEADLAIEVEVVERLKPGIALCRERRDTTSAILREAMDRASRVVIRMRQKVVIPPLPATPPRWVVDPDFDLDYHLRRVALPAPGTLRQLLDLAELTLQSPLDTSRALWEAVYVEGLEGGRSALLTKLSHAITDGLGGIALFEQVYDTERNPEPRPMPPVPVPRDVSGGDLLRDSIRQLPETTFAAGRKLLGRVAGTAARLITQPGATVTEAVGFADSARRVLSPPPAEPSPLLRRRSLVSRTVVLELPLADLRAAAKAFGASVNDAYLAALCGGLGRYHEVLGVPVDAIPLALPVSLRGADDPASGNRFAGATIAAQGRESDPVERMRPVRAPVLERRREVAVGGA